MFHYVISISTHVLIGRRPIRNASLADSWRTANRSSRAALAVILAGHERNEQCNAMQDRARAQSTHLEFLIQCIDTSYSYVITLLSTTMGRNSCYCRGCSCRSLNTTMLTWRNLLLEYTFAVVCGGVFQVNRLKFPRRGWLRVQRAIFARGSRERRMAGVRAMNTCVARGRSDTCSPLIPWTLYIWLQYVASNGVII